jgi:hypothetical protein
MGHLEFSAKKVSKNEDLILKNLRATINDRRRLRASLKKIMQFHFCNRLAGLAWASVPLCTKRHPCASVFKVETKLCLVAKTPIRLSFEIPRKVKYCKIHLPLQSGVLGLRIAGLKSRQKSGQT